jgi:hypothetical protein
MLFITDRPLVFRKELEKRGHHVVVVDGQILLKKVFRCFRPDEIHLMTKIGFFNRFYLRKKAFIAHIFSPKYPSFYKKAKKFFVPSPGARNLLRSQGVDHTIDVLPPATLQEHTKGEPLALEHPVFLFYGDKGIEAFCQMPLPGTKIVIGKYLKKYEHNTLFYPDVPGVVESLFPGADVLIAAPTEEFFPRIFLQAGHYGLPIASHPAFNGKEYIRNGFNGYISYDLTLAALKCLNISKEDCKEAARPYTPASFVDKLTAES